MRVLGAKILEFYHSEWPDGCYIDRGLSDDALDPEAVASDERYDIDDFGYIYFDGRGKPPSYAWGLRHDFNDDGLSFGKAFRAWLKLQSSTTFVVTAPNGKVDEIVAAVAALGGKVKK